MISKIANTFQALILAFLLAAGFVCSASAQTAVTKNPVTNPATTTAASAAPSSQLERLVAPLNGVAQLTVAEPTLVDTRNAADCKLDTKLLRQKLTAALQSEKLPLVADTALLRPELVRLTLRPEVATLKDGVVNCVSWVSLAAEVQDIVRLPPSVDRKPVEVIYWRRGALIMTPIVDHAAGVSDVFDKLAHVLARQWRIDNPDTGAGTGVGAMPPAGQMNIAPAVPAANPIRDIKR